MCVYYRMTSQYPRCLSSKLGLGLERHAKVQLSTMCLVNRRDGKVQCRNRGRTFMINTLCWTKLFSFADITNGDWVYYVDRYKTLLSTYLSHWQTKHLFMWAFALLWFSTKYLSYNEIQFSDQNYGHLKLRQSWP